MFLYKMNALGKNNVRIIFERLGMLIVRSNVTGNISLKKITDESSNLDFHFMQNIKPDTHTFHCDDFD